MCSEKLSLQIKQSADEVQKSVLSKLTSGQLIPYVIKTLINLQQLS